MSSFMRYYIRNIIKPHIKAYARCLKHRLLPSLDNVEQESNRFGMEVYERLCEAHASEDADPASFAEQAMDEGISYAVMMSSITQALINLFAAGLYHLFEQQLMYIYTRSLSCPAGSKSLKFDELRQEFAKADINMDKFRSYSKLQELRHVANCVKHGEGEDLESCAKLRKQRPDLFESIASLSSSLPLDESGEAFKRKSPVRQPLGGEDLYISEKEFDRYVSDVESFWDELADILEGH
jgi:hypothetical protein